MSLFFLYHNIEPYRSDRIGKYTPDSNAVSLKNHLLSKKERKQGDLLSVTKGRYGRVKTVPTPSKQMIKLGITVCPQE